MTLEYLEEACIRYEAGDLLGEALAYCSLGHIFVVIVHMTLVVVVRDVQGIAAFASLLVAAKFTSLLKKYIAQPRPAMSPMSGSGMPSNHSQFLFFFATFHALCLCLCAGPRPKGGVTAGLSRPWKLLYVAALYAAAASVAYSRYYLHYHSAEQVVAGAALGCVLGGGCFVLLYRAPFVQRFLRWVCGLRVARYCRISYLPDFYYPPSIGQDDATAGSRKRS